MRFSKKKIIACCLLCALALFGNTFYIQAKAHLAQYLIADAWGATLVDNVKKSRLEKPHKPWSWADSYPVAKIQVPSHNIEHYVLDGANRASLAFAPGLYAGTRLPSESSALPDTVIAGHHNTHFDFLKHVNISEKLRLQSFSGDWQSYHIQSIDRYDIRTQRLPSRQGGQTLQLVTCLPNYVGEIHPNGRLVVTATRDRI